MGDMIRLEFWNGTEWLFAGKFFKEKLAWISLGGDVINYRILDSAGNVLMDKSILAERDKKEDK
jgi:hypothetical protein